MVSEGFSPHPASCIFHGIVLGPAFRIFEEKFLQGRISSGTQSRLAGKFRNVSGFETGVREIDKARKKGYRFLSVERFRATSSVTVAPDHIWKRQPSFSAILSEGRYAKTPGKTQSEGKTVDRSTGGRSDRVERIRKREIRLTGFFIQEPRVSDPGYSINRRPQNFLWYFMIQFKKSKIESVFMANSCNRRLLQSPVPWRSPGRFRKVREGILGRAGGSKR